MQQGKMGFDAALARAWHSLARVLGLLLAAAALIVATPSRADPRIDALAATLGHDPAQIFAYLRDQVGVELYSGSSRGAVGTLASKAGSPIDRAALGVALLRASGFTARYAQATLGTSDIQRVIARMFPGIQRALGCNNPGAVSDPLNDYALNVYAKTHTWIEYKPTAASPYTAFDPTLAGAAIGSTITAPTGNFDEIPDSQKQRVRFRLVAETYSQAGALYGFPIGSTTVLDQSFDAADLVGKPVSFGHFVTQDSPPGLAITATINTYSPYLVVGDNALDPRDYQVVRGADYSETITNFPLGTTLLTGVTLAIDLVDPADPAHPVTVQRTLVDRIGYAKRQTGGTIDYVPDPEALPALLPLDLMTVQVSPSRQPLDDFAARRTRLAALQAEAAAAAPAVDALPDPASWTADDEALVIRTISLNRAIAMALLEVATTSFEGAANVADDRTASMYLVKATQASPRVTIAQSAVTATGLSLGLDIRRNAMSVYPLPGVSYLNSKQFEQARGFTESVLEGTILEQATGVPARTIASLFAARGTPSDYQALTPLNVSDVDKLALSDDAKARIRDALGANRVVLAPTSPQLVGGAPLTAWFESDIASGASISTFEDGTHGAIVEYVSMYAYKFGMKTADGGMAKFVGNMNSTALASMAWLSGILDAIAADKPFSTSYAETKAIIKDILDNELKRLMDWLTAAGIEFEGPYGQLSDMLSGLLDGLDAFKNVLDLALGDPPVPNVLINLPAPPLPPATAPGGAPGVTVTLAPDPRFVVPYFGAELPTVYLAQVHNTGPATDSFRLTSQGADYPFGIPNASPALTLAPGATGEVSVCLVPGAPVGATGTPVTFSLRVASTTDPTVAGTIAGSFNTPALKAAMLRIQPDVANVKAGQSTTATLTIDSFGNVATNVALSAASAPGLTLSGLPASVTVPAGGSTSLPLAFSVAGGTAAGRSLSSVVTGDFGGVEAPVAAFTATVVSATTQCTVDAGTAATSLGRNAMGGSLFRLAGDMDALSATPADALALTAVLAELDYLTGVQMYGGYDQPYLASAASALAALRTTLASASAAAIPSVLASIDAALCGLRGTLAQASQGDFGLGLAPTTAYNIPSQSTSVAINVYNRSGVPRVFDIAVGGVPAGVTATLSTTTITVPANYQTNGCCGSPSLGVTFANTDGDARAFTYTVTATPHDQPSVSRSADGQLALRPDLIRVVTVTPSPVYGPAGTPIVVSVRAMNSLNTTRNVYGEWTARDRNGVVRAGGNTAAASVSSGDGLFDLPAFTVNTTGFTDGPYTLDVVLRDATQCCDAFPGGSGQGAFIVGIPFSAALSVAPQGVPPGDSDVTVTLAMSHDSLPTPSIVARGAHALPAAARTLARRGHYLYACEEDRVSIIDATDPGALADVGSFATGVLASGYGGVGCNVDGDTLVLSYSGDSPTSFDAVKIVAFDIGAGHETAPVQQNATPADLGKLFGSSILFDGTTGYMPTQIFLYNPFSNFIFQQNGNLLRLDLSTPSAPVLAGELFHHVDASDSNDPVYGGPNLVTGVAQLGTRLYLSTSTSTGGDTGTGVGRLDVVDSTLLAGNCPGSPNPCIGKTIDVPGTRILFGLARQGNTLVAAGDTLGYYDAVRGLTGNLSITAFDLSDPANPVLRSTLITPLNNARYQNQCNANGDAGSATVTALDNQFYAVSGFNPGTCSWVMALVDANDPDNLRVIPYDVTDVLTTTLLDGGTLYAMTRTGILVYDYAILTGPAITARVDMAKGNGVAVVPGSFSLAPTSIDTSDPDLDTYTWVQPSASTITWQAHLTAVEPGETRDVAYGGDVEFTLPSIGHGLLPLGGVAVVSDQAMSIDPPSQTAGLGRPATYTITLDNPSASPVIYALGVAGVDPAWIAHLDTPVAVPAGGSATSTLVLQSTLGDYGLANPFVVIATAPSYSTSGRAVLYLNGFDRPTGPDPTNNATGTLVVPSPNPIAVGRGDTARVTLATTNVGTGLASYVYAPAVVPSGWTVTFENNNVATDPDTELDVVADIATPVGVAPGSYDVEVDLYNGFGYVGRTALTVNVGNAGVRLALSPSSGSPSTVFGVTVSNTGTASDTFDLAAVGPLGPAVSFDAAAVTLAAGASQTVNAALGATVYLPAGSATFDVIAQSRADAAARDRATATVALAATRGLELTGDPTSVNVGATPATRSFAVRLRNAGNVEDSYRLAIVSTTGAVSAALADANAAPVQSIASVALPGTAVGQFLLSATLASGLAGTVTLEARSNSDDSLVASLTLTLSAAAAPALAASPATLAFGSQIIGTTSSTRTSTLSNTGSAPFTVATLAVAGAAPGDYAQQPGANACAVGSVLAAGGGSCTLDFAFTPAAAGARNAGVQVSDGVATSINVPLQGTGAAGDTCVTGAVSGGTATACFTGGGAACRYEHAAFIPLEGDAASPPAGSAPAGYTFPFGLLDFATTGCTTGGTLDFTVTYPRALPSQTVYYKYDSQDGRSPPQWYTIAAGVDGRTLHFSLPAGNVVDPGGPAYPDVAPPPPPAAVVPVPALGDAAMAMLAALLAMLGLARLRRR